MVQVKTAATARKYKTPLDILDTIASPLLMRYAEMMHPKAPPAN